MKASKRKRSLKRTLALVSALSMFGSFSQAIGATTLSYNIISAVAEGEEIEATTGVEPTTGVETTTNVETTTSIETTTTDVEPTQPTTKEVGDGGADKKVIIENDHKFSRIKVEISNQMDMSFNGIDCTVKVVNRGGVDILSDKNGKPTVVNIKDGIGESASVMTEYITNDDYIVTVEAPGFKAFEQTIPANELENMICTVKVTLGFHKNYSYGLEPKLDENGDYMKNQDGDIIYEEPKTVNHPGVLVYGDINGYDGNNGESKNNKSINISDATLLATAIDSYIRLEEATNEYNQAKKVYDSEMTNANKKAMDNAKKAMDTAQAKADEYSLDKYDLNHDGKIDMSDMSYFTKGFIDTRGFETEATLEREVSEKYSAFILQDSVETLPDTVVSKEGSTLEQLLSASIANNSEEDGEIQKVPPMKLEPAKDENGNQILDKDHPVGFDMAVSGESVKGFSFKTGDENGNGKVTEGFIEYDEDGKTITVALDTEERHGLGEESPVTASVDKDGNININLGNQIGIKKIRLKITASNNTNLAEIAEVKVLNGLESKVQEPPIDYPTDVTVTQDTRVDDKYAKIDVLWSPVLLGGGTYEYEVSSSPSTKPDGSFASTIAKKTLSDTEIKDSIAKNGGKIGFSLESEHGNFKLIKTNTTYYVHVRSASAGGEDYKSAWSDVAKVHVEPQQVPAKPDYVTVKGGTKSLSVSWSSSLTNSATSYILCYGKRSEVQDVAATSFKSDGLKAAKETFEAANYKCVELGKTTSYNIIGLEDKVEYKVFVVACNKNGGSPRSDVKSGVTTVTVPVQMHKYGAINIDDEGNIGSNHIVNVYRGSAGITVGNKVDEENANKVAAKEAGAKLTTWSIVDGDQGSYYAKIAGSGSGDRWNNGGWNGPTDQSFVIEFDDVYEFSSFAVTYPYTNDLIQYSCVRYWDENGYYTLKNIGGYSTFKDKNGNAYYLVRLPRTVKTNKLQIGLDNKGGHVSVAEMAFYTKNDTRDKIKNLYADEYHLVLKDNVTQETIDELRAEIEAKDRWGETNPDRSVLNIELDAAEKLLHNAAHLNPPVMIYNKITTNMTHGGKAANYSGLNAWQPIGVSAGANTKILVYVGSSDMDKESLGSVTNLQLVCTQYNSESNGLTLKSQQLRIGENEVYIPAGSLADDEGGGSLYITYSGAMNSAKSYSVRVAGGSPISVLDLFYVNDRMERLERAADYIEALERQVADMGEEHEYAHANAKDPNTNEPNTQLNHKYKATTCIAGATEILSNKMMYSIPAAKVLSGLGNGSVESRAEKLVQSIDAMENMLTLFYQHKGLNPNTSQNSVNNGTGVSGVDINKISNQHLNIRYQRMFEGASMYAAGNHIGIQYGSASGLVNVPGVTSESNGKYISGKYFGWGIAHEIGHNLNDSSYTVPEITNNYFALLAQAQDKNAGSRLKYDKIFKKVSSGTKGKADQGTQLGLYWQLHLAYDKDYNYKTYSTSQEILDNLFYARMDTYSRNPSAAPNKGGPELKLNGGSEQNLMRLACAAAEKNVLEFFERWGMTPDKATIAYASQFGKEKRAIMYANEDSRVYAMNGESYMTTDENGDANAAAITSVDVKVGTGSEANKVKLSINVIDVLPKEEILGYEIIRRTISRGKVIETPIGFTKTPTFEDTVTAFNNRTVSYKVTLIDQYLYRSAPYFTDMVKISHDGSLDKTNWSVSISETATGKKIKDSNGNNVNEMAEDLKAEKIVEQVEDLPCSLTIHEPALAVIDNDLETVYEPEVMTNKASIILNLHQSIVVTGMKYTVGDKANSIGEYKAYVKSEDDTGWIEVASGTFDGKKTVYPIYFNNSDNKYLSTYDTTAVRLEIINQKGKKISIAELDVLGVTGDNVDFRRVDEGADVAFGTLATDYKYGRDAEDFIPKGSIVFTGSYKGSPSYNVVILYDENGNMVGKTKSGADGTADQVIFADIPNGGEITDVKDGTWVYWIEPDNLDDLIWPEKVRVELYRVNDINLNTGQRIVSDSLFEEVLPMDKMLNTPIKLTGEKKYDDTETTIEVTTDTDSQ